MSKKGWSKSEEGTRWSKFVVRHTACKKRRLRPTSYSALECKSAKRKFKPSEFEMDKLRSMLKHTCPYLGRRRSDYSDRLGETTVRPLPVAYLHNVVLHRTTFFRCRLDIPTTITGYYTFLAAVKTVDVFRRIEIPVAWLLILESPFSLRCAQCPHQTTLKGGLYCECESQLLVSTTFLTMLTGCLLYSVQNVDISYQPLSPELQEANQLRSLLFGHFRARQSTHWSASIIFWWRVSDILSITACVSHHITESFRSVSACCPSCQCPQGHTWKCQFWDPRPVPDCSHVHPNHPQSF